MTPKISIIVPCYNQAQYLDECLQSVIDQTFQNWECIIVNDGSPDHTAEIAHQWLQKDNRFKYIYKPNGGLSSARNAGIEMALGEFIQFLDCDDVLKADKLTISIESISPENYDLIITNFDLFENTLSEIKDAYCHLNKIDFNLQNILNLWDIEFTIPIHCGLFSQKTFKNFAFDETLAAKEDWLLWIYVFNQNPKINYINQILVSYRIHLNSLTKNKSKMSENYDLVLNKIRNYVSDDDYATFLLKRIYFYKQNYEALVNISKNHNKLLLKLNSKKYIINLFCKTFFKWQLFKKFKIA